MCCHCSSSSTCPSPLMELPLPLLELTFASLPLRSVLSLSSSCKLLHSLVSSAPFALLHSRSLRNRSPWFFFFGFNFLLPQKNQAFAFDPLLHSWVRLPFTPPPPHNTSSLSAMNGTMFALISAKQSQICVALSPLKQEWHVIEGSMAVSRKDPLVGMFVEDGVLAPNLGNCSIVVVGGGDEDTREDEKLAVEVLRGSTGNWERCESMPEKMRGKTLCSAVVGDMFYVADCEGSTVCRLDVKKGMWTECKAERPKEVTWWQLVGANCSLWAVAASRRAIKLYKIMVDPEMEGGKLEEMGTMPQELYDHMFEEVEEEEEEEEVAVEAAATLHCCGGGDNLLYIYRHSCFREYITCACDLSNMRWVQMPSLPEPVHRFDKVACLSSRVSLS